jgi:hypothetical protein
MNYNEINDEFRMIISHAFLGCDTSNIDRETWELALKGCTEFAIKLVVERPVQYFNLPQETNY